MTDTEFIVYLCTLIWNDVSDGDTPDQADFSTMENELRKRGLNPDEIFSY